MKVALSAREGGQNFSVSTAGVKLAQPRSVTGLAMLDTLTVFVAQLIYLASLSLAEARHRRSDVFVALRERFALMDDGASFQWSKRQILIELRKQELKVQYFHANGMKK